MTDRQTDRHTAVSVQNISIIPLPAYISVLLVRITTKLVEQWFAVCGPRNLQHLHGVPRVPILKNFAAYVAYAELL